MLGLAWQAMESGFLSIKKQNADPGPLLIQASAQFEESLILKGPWSPPASMLESDTQGGSKSAQVHQGVAPGKALQEKDSQVSPYGRHNSTKAPLGFQ